ncbi:MAG: dUTP diphosphatase [Clostridia bacterium]|nr:dUTP diphosphatase [Clostridia bacterium]
MDKEIKIKILRSGAKIPDYATEGSAAADLRSAAEEPVVILPGARAMIPTGVAISLGSPEYVALIFARSGLAVKKGICLANGVGVIDSDYTGELIVGLLNTSDQPFTVEPGDRIAQLAVMPVCRGIFTPVADLEETERGAGGFGSTGVK